MNAIRIETIEDKLFQLDQNIKFIEDIVADTDAKVLGEMPRYYGLEHILQLSIQNILDTGAHILAEEFHDNPKEYQGVIESLGTHGIIDKSFAEEQKEMAKFRNKLVHDYDLVDKKKVLEYAREAPRIFKIFGKAYARFVEEHRKK